MSTATIDYTGIIGFHPKRDAFGVITSLLVLAPDARGHQHHHHECWLRVLSGSPTVGGNVSPNTETCDDESTRYLLNEVMTLNGVPPNATFDPHGIQGKIVPLERSHSDLKARRLDQALKSRKKHARVSLWSELTAGEFTGIKLSECGWKFNHWADAEPAIALAQVVRQVVELEENSLELRFERANGEEYSLTFTTDDGPIHVEIGNTPKACESVGSSTDDDHHVKLFNLLAVTPKSMHQLNHLECLAEIHDVDGANCPPGWWEESG